MHDLVPQPLTTFRAAPARRVLECGCGTLKGYSCRFRTSRGVRELPGLRKAVAAFAPHCATAVQRISPMMRASLECGCGTLKGYSCRFRASAGLAHVLPPGESGSSAFSGLRDRTPKAAQGRRTRPRLWSAAAAPARVHLQLSSVRWPCARSACPASARGVPLDFNASSAEPLHQRAFTEPADVWQRVRQIAPPPSPPPRETRASRRS